MLETWAKYKLLGEPSRSGSICGGNEQAVFWVSLKKGPDPKCCLSVPSMDAAWLVEFVQHFVFSYGLSHTYTNWDLEWELLQAACKISWIWKIIEKQHNRILEVRAAAVGRNRWTSFWIRTLQITKTSSVNFSPQLLSGPQSSSSNLLFCSRFHRLQSLAPLKRYWNRRWKSGSRK